MNTYTPKRQIKEPYYIYFSYFDTTQGKPEWKDDGVMQWNGHEWIVNKENPAGTLHNILNKTWTIFGREYTSKDRDFYEPFYYNPTSRQRVVVTEGAFPITEKPPPQSDYDTASHTTA